MEEVFKVSTTEPSDATPKKPWYKRARYVIPLAIVIVLLVVSLVPVLPTYVSPDQKSLNKAVGYFAKYYDVKTGLIPSTPNGTTYFLYSDNYLASVALQRYSTTNSSTLDFSEAVYAALSGYASTLPPSLLRSSYTTLNSTYSYFGCTSNYTIGWRTSNGTSIPIRGADDIETVSISPVAGSCASENYADLLFLQAIYYYKQGNTTVSSQYYNRAVEDFDGMGLADLAFTLKNSTSYGVYQTSNLALYVYADACMAKSNTDPNFPFLNSTLVHMQDPATGGFFAGYDSDLQHVTGVTTQATALASLALEEIVSPSIGC